jgi:hypothetical protein
VSAAVEVTGEAFHRRNKMAKLKGREPATRITARSIGAGCWEFVGADEAGHVLWKVFGAKP